MDIRKDIIGSTYNFGFALESSTFADCILKLCVSPSSNEMWNEGSCDVKHPKKKEVVFLEEESDGSDKDCTPPNRTRSSIPSFSSHGIFGLSSTDVYSESSESSNDVEKEKIQTDQILVREVPVTAVILAAKSTFFLKMFTAGMSESLNKGSVSVHVTASEEAVFMELLHFIYTGEISSQFSESFDYSLQLLLMADRFGVEDCLLYCVETLVGHLSSISVKEALLFLAMPQTVLTNPALNELLIQSKAVVVSHFGPLMESREREEFLSLSLTGLQVLLKADALMVENEETVFTALMEWLNHNYKNHISRTEVLEALVKDIRFTWMSAEFLREKVLCLPEMKSQSIQSYLVDCLLLKATLGEGHLDFPSSKHLVFCQPRLSYTPPTKSIFFDIPFSVCKGWAPDEAFQASSQAFCVGGKWFTLNAKLDNQKDSRGSVASRFGLFLRLDLRLTFPHGGVVSDVDCSYQFCFKASSSEASYQVVKSKSACTFKEPYHGWGSRDLFRKPWQEIIDNHDVYFPGGAMHLRADLWITS